MKRTWIFALATIAAIGTAGWATQGLVPLPPSAPSVPDQEPDDLDSWRALLTDPDLDLREQAFERAVRGARERPGLRDALRRWAGMEGDRELAWTCRLLLRDLQRAPAQFGTGGWDPFAAAGALPGWGENRMDELFQGLEDLHGNLDQLFEDLDRDGLGVPVAPGTSRAEGLQLRTGPDGVECSVTVEEDGRKVTKTYRAASLEELLEQHPELRERLQFRELGGTSFLGQRGLPGLQALPPRGPTGRWDSQAPREPLRTDILGVVVAPLEPERARELGLEAGQGLSVERVEPGTIADVLGVRRGHVLVELDGRPLRERDDISAVLGERQADSDLRLVLIDRFGQRRTRIWKAGPAAPQAAEAPPGAVGQPRRF